MAKHPVEHCLDCGQVLWAKTEHGLEKAKERHVDRCKGRPANLDPNESPFPDVKVEKETAMPSPELNMSQTQKPEAEKALPPAPKIDPVLEQILQQSNAAISTLAQNQNALVEVMKSQGEAIKGLEQKQTDVAAAVQYMVNRIHQQDTASQSAPSQQNNGQPSVSISPVEQPQGGGMGGGMALIQQLAPLLNLLKSQQAPAQPLGIPNLEPLVTLVKGLREIGDVFHQNDSEVARTTAMIFQQSLKAGAEPEEAAQAIIDANPPARATPATQPAAGAH